MADQDKAIEPGDRVRVNSGSHAGEMGTAIDVMWYSSPSDMHALVRVMSDVGTSEFYDMRMLEKVKVPSDNSLPFDRGERTWKQVK